MKLKGDKPVNAVELRNPKINHILYVLLGIAIFSRIIMQQFTITNFMLFLLSIPVGLMVLIEFLNMIQSRRTVRQLTFYFFMFIVTLLCIKNSSAITFFFLVAFSSISLSIKGILKTYFYAVLCSIIVVILIASFRFTTFFYQGIVTLGFLNPNTLGFYIALLSLIYMYLRWDFMNWKDWMLMIVIVLFCFKYLLDYTAVFMIAGMLLLNLVIRGIPFLSKSLIIKMLVIIVPLALTMLTFWLGENYGRFNFISEVNQVTSMRPQIWHYYLMNYPIKPFGQLLNDNFLFIMNGQTVFDGTYLIFPLEHGWVIFGLFVILTTVSLRKLIKVNNWALISVYLMLLFSGFSENCLMNYYQSPLFLLVVAVIFSSFSAKKIFVFNQDEITATLK
ncbi:hypothetical protein ACA610_16585 [Lactiplantibacillus pentosus]|uniref:hypothetical protein n=1 Tax=Lactiplantibacillus pentosus TaxID=1589 RepID=UPI003C238976